MATKMKPTTQEDTLGMLPERAKKILRVAQFAVRDFVYDLSTLTPQQRSRFFKAHKDGGFEAAMQTLAPKE
jgi:hypothetical protein